MKIHVNHLLKQYKVYLLLTFIIIIGAFLRFYKLDWGEGLFTHPDEYHIVASVNQLSFPNQMHPHFFSYGTVTIYLIYFTQELLKNLSQFFPQSGISLRETIFNSFLVGRFYSTLFSTLTIFIVYKISKTFMKTQFSLLAALLTAMTPGLIQQAHFATPESALTFFLFCSLFFLIKFIKLDKVFYLILASIFLGLALGVKISSFVFLLPLILSIILKTYLKSNSFVIARSPAQRDDEAISAKRLPHQSTDWFAMTGRLIILTLTSLTTTLATFALVAPYVFIDYPAFRSNLEYEGGLAIGKIPVFYTRQFIDTVPVLFQMEKIFPYALGPVLLVFGVLGFFLIVVKHLGWWQADPERSRRRSHDSSEVDGHLRGVHSATSKVFIIIAIAFLSLFISNAILFAKWTRFIAPTFPFFAIFAAFFLQWLSKRTKLLSNSLLIILLVGTILWTTAFFSIYTNSDVRITASEWLESNIKPGSVFLVEGGNMVDLPLRGNFPIISLDFYNLENDELVRTRIADALYTSDYFLVQSRRVFMNHQRLPHLYPKTARFYDALFSGRLGFEQIKAFHSYPKLGVGNFALSGVEGWKLEFPDEDAEETWSVFDHPVIRIFKKNAQLTRDGYLKVFE